jgi:hypothetical protein
MKKMSFLVPLLLCLAIFGNPRPGLANSWNQIPTDLLIRLEKEGWKTAAPGVMQHTVGNTVETLGFGDDGLRFKIKELKAHLAFLRKEFARHPSLELRRAIRAHRAEILRAQEALRKAGELDSSADALVATGANCSANYDATGRTFPLATQGTGAQADAYFDNPCGYTGEVYAHAYARAISAANVITSSTQSDPAPDTPRVGTNVSATASVSVNGVKDCYSYSYSSVTSYDLEVTYSRSATNTECADNKNVRPFAQDAPMNLLLPNSPPLHPNSAAIVANLNSANWHGAKFRDGIPVFDGGAGTPRTIVCSAVWGTCPLSQQPVPIHASWKPTFGSLSVIDYTNRKVYDFYEVATNLDGTVKINSDGTVTTTWGGVTSLDGDGQSPGATGSNLPHLFGIVRVFEMARAASDPVNAVQHALAFGSMYVCPTYRYPATKSSGSSTSAGCIPMGSRVFLDSSANCSTVSPVGERAICYALQKYGAYATGRTGDTFKLGLEIPTDGQPGGSAPDPYTGAGLGDDYGLKSIPWDRLKVAADCRCSSSDLTATGGRMFAQKAAVNVALPASPQLNPNSSTIAANLNSSSEHMAHLYSYGRPVYDASAGTPRTIVCTASASWGPCELSSQPVPIHASWKPSPGDGILSVIDYTNRKSYEFYNLAMKADGTVMINSDGTVSAEWGAVTDLDGGGPSDIVSGSGLSRMFGTVRVFEMARAATDPANAIQHALSLSTSYACTTYLYPATKSKGWKTGTGCLPMGGRVFLDASADCSIVSPVGEKAICYALQKYGAYVTHTSSYPFILKFEAPTAGLPGGSGPDPYPGVGLTRDSINLSHIPWSKLKVAKDCQCTPY